MASSAPAAIGMRLSEIATPALLIELDAFEHNLQTMANAITAHGVSLRPHAKTHKSPIIARRQMALGAVGACCQTVAEAEALAQGGVPDVLVSNQVIGKQKIARLAALATQARVGVCVDDATNIDDLGEAAAAFSSRLNVLIEIDVGMGRCGVPPGVGALALAHRIEQTPCLEFGGLQAYHGSAQHIREFAERRAAIAQATRLTRETIELLERNGIETKVVAGAGTGTFHLEAVSGVYNELQAGSYVFMDADYAKNKKADGGLIDEFRHSLFVLATVISTPTSDRVVIDAGLKAHSVDSGLPTVHEMHDVHYRGASDEHGVLRVSDSNRRFSIGEKVQLIPGHCDPTVNLHDWYVGVRDGQVEALWPVAARGPGV